MEAGKKSTICLAMLLAVASAAFGQSDATNNPPDDPVLTMFPHSDSSRYWISGQDNVIFQWHPTFNAKYSGPNSLRTKADHATSNVVTLFLGYQLKRTTEILVDIEASAGGGLSDGLGLAGFTNLDVVRNPALSKAPYLARGLVRQIIPLGKKTVEADRNPLALSASLPERRLEFRAGKFGTADFFDLNGIGSDSHLQFLNWTVDNNGAYDYAADTRGYTVGLIAEYHDRNWAFRFGELLMPKVANGIDLQWNLRRARGENFELELHPGVWAQHSTTLRLLAFVNHANMGVYRRAVEDFQAGKAARPDVTAHPEQVTVKYGFGVNLEQSFSHHVRGFARWGWNEGQHESYAYTEVDSTVELGGDIAGRAWLRADDRVGGVFVTNGLCADHQHYLALGGLGFLLGDGSLNYGRENIVESYYNAHVWRGFFLGFDLQQIQNPGYNRDRGPVLVPGFRVHLEL